jgi:hypothetical protein
MEEITLGVFTYTNNDKSRVVFCILGGHSVKEGFKILNGGVSVEFIYINEIVS